MSRAIDLATITEAKKDALILSLLPLVVTNGSRAKWGAEIYAAFRRIVAPHRQTVIRS